MMETFTFTGRPSRPIGSGTVHRLPEETDPEHFVRQERRHEGASSGAT